MSTFILGSRKTPSVVRVSFSLVSFDSTSLASRLFAWLIRWVKVTISSRIALGSPEAQVGDYVIVHVGFAISRIDEAEAQEVFGYLQQIGEIGDSMPDPQP